MRTTYPKDFEAAWRAYPRHVGKDAAFRRWEKVTEGATPQQVAQIVRGVENYARQRAGQDPKRTAHMATWLNAGRWRDDEDEDQADAGNDTPPGYGRSARDVLERIIFADCPSRARYFISYIMPPTRSLHLRDADDGSLAYAAGRLLLEVERQRGAAAGLPCEPIELLWQYLAWVSEHEWAATLAVLRIDSRAFEQYRAELARADDAGRDPVTGRSKYG